MRGFGFIIGLCVALISVTTSRSEDTSGTLVDFRSGNSMLRGVVYKPAGKGPFPVVIFERGGNAAIGDNTKMNVGMAHFYTSHGYVFFTTSRRTASQLSMEEKGVPIPKHHSKRVSSLPEYESQTKDVAAAVNWIKLQSYVDENRVVVAGYDAGGVASLLAAEQNIGVRAYVIFSPYAEHWKQKPEIGQALADAVQEAKAPLFLIQAQNDFTLAPSELLGRAIAAKGKPNICKVYPPFRTTHEQGNKFAHDGISIWGGDVVAFFEQALN